MYVSYVYMYAYIYIYVYMHIYINLHTRSNLHAYLYVIYIHIKDIAMWSEKFRVQRVNVRCCYTECESMSWICDGYFRSKVSRSLHWGLTV